MAINPVEITTVRVGELVPAIWSLPDLLPHEVDGALRQGSVQGLADLISDYIGTVSSLAFNPTTVNSGETLPATTTTEWMFVGKGTFLNVGGGAEIITTEELNVLTSNGSYWSLAVQIPIDVEFSGVVQTIRSGYTQTVPSENAVFDALFLKLNTGGYTGTAQDLYNLISMSILTATENSAGAIKGFAVTNNGDGTVNIDGGTAFLRATNDQYAPLVKYTIPAVTNLALTDNANNYVLVDYNGGSPALTVTTNGATINTETNSIAILISRVGNTLDWLSLVGQNNDANAKLRIRFLNQEGIRRANGAIIGFVNRNLTLTAGTLFSGLIRINSPAFNTVSPDTFTYVYNNGSAWTRVIGQTQVNNTQYNNSGTLTTMPNNDFRTDYVYLLPNNPSKLYVVYGSATYANITLARNAPTPASLPSELQVLGLLVGRQIIQKNASVISEVSSAFAEVFTGVGVPEHNALAGLQGGVANDYQHLTTVQLNGLIQKNTIAQIRAFSGTLTNTIFYTTDLNQEGNWYYDASDTTTADNTGTVLVTSDGKRIKRITTFITPEMFGAKGDGTTDDTTTLSNALSLGLPLVFKSKATYLVSSGFTITDKDIFIDGNNASIKTSNVSENYILNHIVTNNTKYNVSSISVGTVGINTYTTIIFSGIITDLKKGDVMKIFSSDLSFTSIPDIYKGEFLTVNNVSASGGNTTVTVYGNLDYTYTTSIKIAKIKTNTVKVKNLSVYSGSETHALGFISLKGTYSPRIENPIIDRTDWPFITATGCYRPTIINPIVNYVGDAIDGNSSVTNAIGYGVNDNNCYGLQIIGGNLSNLRHSYTTGGSVTDVNDYDLYGETNGAVISGVIAKNCQTAFDTHEPGYNITFDNCHVENSRIGFQTRSRDVKINNCTTKDVDYATNIRNLNGVSPSEKNGVYINNLVMSGNSIQSIQSVNTTADYVSYIRVIGGDLIGAIKCYDSDMLISGSNIKLNSTSTEWATVNNSTFKAYNLNIKGNVSSSFSGVVVESTDPSTVVTKDVVIDVATSGLVYVTRATTGSTNKIGIFESTTYLSSAPTMSEATADRPYTGDSAFIKLKYSFKQELFSNGAYTENYSNRLVVRPDGSNKLLFGNKYIMDDVIVCRFSLLVANSSIDAIDRGTHPGQVMILTNPNNFTVTFNNITNIEGDPNAVLKANATMILFYDGTSNKWTTFNSSFDRLRDKPTTISGYGITDAFINRGSIATSVDLNTFTTIGNYFRGSNSGNTPALNYPSTLKGHLLVFPFTSTEVGQIYIDGSGAQFTRVNNSGTWSAWSASTPRPYKSYLACVTQTGTASPTVLNLYENTLGGTIVWTRTAAGEYTGTLTGLLPLGKTSVVASNRVTGGIPDHNDDEIYLVNKDFTGTNVDVMYTIVEVRVYP